MRHDLSDDQTFFRETTAKFLAEFAPPDELRVARGDADGFDRGFWRRGAELGWTSLLVEEDHGGGSISGDGVVDLTLIAHEFGAAAAPGPLLGTNVVASALGGAAGRGDALDEVLAGLLAGTTIATWCGVGAQRTNDAAPEIRVDGGDVVVSGVTRPVEAGAAADHVLVSGRTGDGITQVLVPTDAPGVTVTPMDSVDLTRRFATASFEDVHLASELVVGEVGGADDDIDRQRRLALVIVNAESVGTMQTAFDMTVEWAFDRYSFGRPLASYQALKHRFADMKMWLEASHAIADEAAAAVAAGAPDADLRLSAAKAYVGQNGSELHQDCVQLHGGIGVTFEHDLHLYLRRHTVDRAWFGGPAEQLRRIADIVEAEEAA